MAVSPEAETGTEVSTQDGGLSRCEHQRQFVAESLTLSLNDNAAFLHLFRAIDYLDRLPRCNMQVLARAEHPVQHAAYSAQRHVAGMKRRQWSSPESGW